ncbi:MAG: hypothetical protein NVS4B3_18880 [Gemmatimonadaceae bacterium]
MQRVPSLIDSTGGETTVRAIRRYLAQRFGAAFDANEGRPPLEVTARSSERAHFTHAQVIEGTIVRPRRIPGDPVVGFSAFLDGIQESRVIHYLPGAVPLVYATVAAVVRERRHRRMVTWRERTDRILCIPRRLVPQAWDAGMRVSLVDTTGPHDPDASGSLHPTELIERAIAAAQTRRKAVEQDLAEAWCAVQRGPPQRVLFIDGGIGDRERVARSSSVIGVIKSHRTLYAEGSALTATLALARGERSSVFVVAADRRTPVLSWYLRLRDPKGRDPFWGLVRVEAATESLAGETLTRRADTVSSWILAEAAPLALPDTRWDKMVYGVRDCEEYLRAIV